MYKPMYGKSQYPGRLEIREDLEAMAKKLRMKRMQEVREQERLIAIARTQEYRDKINQRKETKMITAKDSKREAIVSRRDQIAVQWQCSLAKTGEAHRGAQLSKQETIERHITTETTTTEQRIFAETRHKEALELIRTKRAEAQRRINDMLYLKHVRDDAKQEEREDAHARREAEEIKERMNRPPVEVRNTQYFHQVVQSAERVDHRFPVKIQAKVIRHGVLANDDTVFNEAKQQETVTIKNNWDHLMTEMKQKKAVKQRAVVAKSVAIKHRGSQNLEEQLKVLSVVDRAGARLHRIKETHQVNLDEENSKVKHAFEKLFMVSAIPAAEDGDHYAMASSMPLLPPSPPQMRSQMRPNEMAVSRSPMSPYDAMYHEDASSTTSYSSATSFMADSLFDASKLSTSHIFNAAPDYSTDEESLSPDASHLLPDDWRNVEGIEPHPVAPEQAVLEQSFDTNPELNDSHEDEEVSADVMQTVQSTAESPGYLSESSPFAKISAPRRADPVVNIPTAHMTDTAKLEFNDSSLSEENIAAKTDLMTSSSSDSDLNRTTLTELLAKAEPSPASSPEAEQAVANTTTAIRPLTTFYQSTDLAVRHLPIVEEEEDDNQSISSLGSASSKSIRSTVSEVVRSFEKDIGKGISMSQSSSSVSSIAFEDDHPHTEGVADNVSQASSDVSTNRLLSEWEKRYNLVQESPAKAAPVVEDRLLREQARIQREYLDEQLRIRKLQEERERRTQLQQQELARQRQELVERMQALGSGSPPMRASPPQQPQPAQDALSTSSSLSSEAFFQANIPSTLLHSDHSEHDHEDDQDSDASSISLSVHLTHQASPPQSNNNTTVDIATKEDTKQVTAKTHFADDLTSHILNEVSSEIEADLLEESSSQSSTSFSNISSTFLSQSQDMNSTLLASDPMSRPNLNNSSNIHSNNIHNNTSYTNYTTTRYIPTTASPVREDRKYNTSGLFSDESSNMDLQSEGYSHAGSTLTEIQHEILEMRRRLMMAVSYPNPSAIPTISANPYTRNTTALGAATTTTATTATSVDHNYTNFSNTYNSTMTNLDVLGSALRTYQGGASMYHDSSDDSSDAIVYGKKELSVPAPLPARPTTATNPQDVSMDSLQEGSLSSEDYKSSPLPATNTYISSSNANNATRVTASSSSSGLNLRATSSSPVVNNTNTTYRATYSTTRTTAAVPATSYMSTRQSLDDTSLSTGSLQSGEYEEDYLRSSMQSQASRNYQAYSSSTTAKTTTFSTNQGQAGYYETTSTPSKDTLSNHPIDSSYSLTGGSRSQYTPQSHSDSSPSKLYSTGTLSATQFYQTDEDSDEEDANRDMVSDDDLSHQSSLA